MYPISNAVKALFEAEQRQVLRITGTDRNGTAINITEADVMQGGFNIDRYSCNGGKLEIGTAIASELTLKLDNRGGQFNDVVFEGTELFVEIGIADWTQESPTISYIPCGYFTSYEQPRSLSTITLHALDRMTMFDDVAASVTTAPWTTNTGAYVTDNNGEIIYFSVALSFPCTVAQFINQIASYKNVPFTQDISGLPNATMMILALPSFEEQISFRNIIQWLAGLMGTNAWIDWTGSLRFSWFNNSTGYVMTTENRFNSDLYENQITITGVEFQDTDEDKTVYFAGTRDYALSMTGNPYITASNVSDTLSNIYNAVHDFVYTPFSATVISAPWLWPMDRVVYTDKSGTTHASLLTNVNLTVNGNTNIAATGLTDQANNFMSLSSFTPKQQQVLETIQRVNTTALSEAVDHATQMITGGLGGYVILKVNETTGQTEEILIMDTPDVNTAVNVWRFNQGGLGHSSNGYNGPFNDIALTADGKINANMITVGTMVADRIMGGTLKLGGVDNNNGVLNILNSSGQVVGTWDKTGLSVNNGAFSVDTSGKLTAGNSELSGSLTCSGTYGATPGEVIIQGGSIRANKAGAEELWIAGSTFMALEGKDLYFVSNYPKSPWASVTLGANGNITVNATKILLYPTTANDGGIYVAGFKGVDGDFTTADGKTVAVRRGLVVQIS